MLIERNENKKDVGALASKALLSPRGQPKPSKENQQVVNTRDGPLNSSKAPLSDSAITAEDLRTTETNKIVADYLKKILANELSKAPDNFRGDFLSRHRFGWEIRARMVG
jgi:hypothetical protein